MRTEQKEAEENRNKENGDTKSEEIEKEKSAIIKITVIMLRF